MTVLTMPRKPWIKSIEWTIDEPAQVNRSEFTGARRVQEYERSPRWSATVTLVTVLGEPAMKPFRAFLQRCKGPSKSFRLPATENPQIHARGVVVVDGAGQEGFTLATKGWVPGAYLLEGDFLTIGNQLIGIDALVIADEDGKAEIPLLQYLRSSPANEAAVEVRDPYAVMSLLEPKNGWKVDPGQEYSAQFACEEAW